VEFRAAAHAITDPAGNEPTETKAAGRGGGDSHRATAAALVEDYLRLCRNPAQDILRWLKETDDSPGVVYLTRPIRRGERDVLVLSQKAHPNWKSPDGYAATHCTKCKFGWTRIGQNGSLTVCLLDRQPVLSGMIKCDRYDPPTTPAEPQLLPPSVPPVPMPPGNSRPTSRPSPPPSPREALLSAVRCARAMLRRFSGRSRPNKP
jgi:hypothetical protein